QRDRRQRRARVAVSVLDQARSGQGARGAEGHRHPLLADDVQRMNALILAAVLECGVRLTGLSCPATTVAGAIPSADCPASASAASGDYTLSISCPGGTVTRRRAVGH